MSSNRIRVLLVSLLAVFAVSAVASSSASAALKWETCEKVAAGTGKFTNGKCTTEGAPNEFEWDKLEAGESEPLTSSGGTFKLEASGVTVTCTAVADKGELKGGSPGTDTATEILFTGCTTNKEHCKVKSAKGKQKAGEVLVTPNTPSELALEGTKVVDVFKGTHGAGSNEFVTLEFGETEKVVGVPPNDVHTLEKGGCALANTAQVTGNVAAEVVGEELHFPSPAFTLSTLKVFGLGAKLVGNDTQKLTSGLTFRATSP